MKEVGGETLLQALRLVLDGNVYVSPRMSARLGLTDQKLTDREFEVFQLIGQGKSTRDIARQLHLSSKTVDVHRGHIK